MVQVIPRINVGIANSMTTPYKTLLLVKRQILRYGYSVDSQVGKHASYLIPRYICVARAASAVARGVNIYGHPDTPRTVSTRLNEQTGTMFPYLQELLGYHSWSLWNVLKMSRVEADKGTNV